MKIKWEAKHNPENALDFWGWQGFADGQGYWAEDGQGAQCQRDHDAFIERIAVANGYIKLEPGQVIVDENDLDSYKARIRELEDFEDLVNGESNITFHDMAISNDYIKLEPGQVVVDVTALGEIRRQVQGAMYRPNHDDCWKDMYNVLSLIDELMREQANKAKGAASV